MKDPNVYFSAERTLLSWIRTGLSLMGFGFVVARFGLLQSAQPQSPRFSEWLGIALILIGVLAMALAAAAYVRLVRDLNRGLATFDRPSSQGIFLAVVLAAVGVAMAGYLVFVP
jgi:putative membrane protein